jgi:hypothetical protein
MSGYSKRYYYDHVGVYYYCTWVYYYYTYYTATER